MCRCIVKINSLKRKWWCFEGLVFERKYRNLGFLVCWSGTIVWLVTHSEA